MIRRANPDDRAWIRDLAAEVYAEFGDYGRILPTWLDHAGVLTYVDETDAGRRGFILLGFYAPDDVSPGTLVADLLAIAVEPAFQGQGVGHALLDHAIELSRLAGQQAAVRELRLTVAHTNLRAQGLFRKAGFQVLDANHGSYDGGQRAIRMRLKL